MFLHTLLLMVLNNEINLVKGEEYCSMVDAAQYFLPRPLEEIHSKAKISFLLPANKYMIWLIQGCFTRKGPKMKAPVGVLAAEGFITVSCVNPRDN